MTVFALLVRAVSVLAGAGGLSSPAPFSCCVVVCDGRGWVQIRWVVRAPLGQGVPVGTRMLRGICLVYRAAVLFFRNGGRVLECRRTTSSSKTAGESSLQGWGAEAA